MTDHTYVVISIGEYGDSLSLDCCGKVFTLWHGSRHAEIKIAEHRTKGCKE